MLTTKNLVQFAFDLIPDQNIGALFSTEMLLLEKQRFGRIDAKQSADTIVMASSDYTVGMRAY